jgi:hypothetical protein
MQGHNVSLSKGVQRQDRSQAQYCKLYIAFSVFSGDIILKLEARRLYLPYINILREYFLFSEKVKKSLAYCRLVKSSMN